LPAKENPTSGKDTQSGDKNNDKKTCCPKCGGTLENNEAAALEDIFPDDEFICPACCCGIYIESKEE
jgi:hypothetical protein